MNIFIFLLIYSFIPTLNVAINHSVKKAYANFKKTSCKHTEGTIPSIKLSSTIKLNKNERQNKDGSSTKIRKKTIDSEKNKSKISPISEGVNLPPSHKLPPSQERSPLKKAQIIITPEELEAIKKKGERRRADLEQKINFRKNKQTCGLLNF